MKQSKKQATANAPNNAVLITVWIALVLIVCGLFLYADWHRYFGTLSRETTTLAESLESLIHPEHVASLVGADGEARERHYNYVKTSLVRLTATRNGIAYAFLITAQDDGFVCLADSADPSDPAAATPLDPPPGGGGRLSDGPRGQKNRAHPGN